MKFFRHIPPTPHKQNMRVHNPTLYMDAVVGVEGGGDGGGRDVVASLHLDVEVIHKHLLKYFTMCVSICVI